MIFYRLFNIRKQISVYKQLFIVYFKLYKLFEFFRFKIINNQAICRLFLNRQFRGRRESRHFYLALYVIFSAFKHRLSHCLVKTVIKVVYYFLDTSSVKDCLFLFKLEGYLQRTVVCTSLNCTHLYIT